MELGWGNKKYVTNFCGVSINNKLLIRMRSKWKNINILIILKFDVRDIGCKDAN
jgi:hypothetical protein